MGRGQIDQMGQIRGGNGRLAKREDVMHQSRTGETPDGFRGRNRDARRKKRWKKLCGELK